MALVEGPVPVGEDYDRRGAGGVELPEVLQDEVIRSYGCARIGDLLPEQVHAGRGMVQVRQQGRDLAKKLGVTPTPPKDDQGAKDHAAAMTRLRGLSGPAFDQAFLQHEAAFHKAVIDAVTSTLLPAIQNAELKTLVVQVAPAFEAHMIAAQNLEKKLAGR